MYSVLRFVAASVIAALFGGFLLAGVFDAPSDSGPVPAAPTVSPSATTTADLLAGMHTEEVEPGVLRVVNDGYRDLTLLPGTWGQHGGVTIGSEGAVWIHTASGHYFRVGEEQSRVLPREFLSTDNSPQSTFGADALQAGPGGQLWARDARLGRVTTWIGDEWIERADLAVEAMAVDDHNEAWAANRWGLLHADAEDETLIAWPDASPREVAPYTLAISADGRAFVLAGSPEADPEAGLFDMLLRYDRTGWTELGLPSPISAYFPGDGMGVGADGTVWVAGDDHGDTDYMHHRLARLDGAGWTTFTDADGVEPWGGKEGFVPEETLGVSTDGSVWVDASTSGSGWWAECDGVARFDGVTWTEYLPGQCLVDIDFAPDGSAWVLATKDGTQAEIYPYVITPEALVTTE
jgi:hypothetical protein